MENVDEIDETTQERIIAEHDYSEISKIIINASENKKRSVTINNVSADLRQKLRKEGFKLDSVIPQIDRLGVTSFKISW